MKKTITLLLILAFVFSFCSCSGGNSNETSKNYVTTATTEIPEEPNMDYENAQKAYEMLEKAENLCKDGMDDIYGAWYFGIYDADSYTSSTVFKMLALQTSFSATELSTNGGYSGSLLVSGLGSTSEWQFCLWTVQNCLEARGDFAEVDSLLEESKTLIQNISKEYEYYSAFKNYYTKVASYAEFFKATTGSFNQLQNTISSYENEIRTAKEIFKFDFE